MLSSLTALISGADAVRNPRSLFVLLIVTTLVMYGLSVGRTKALVSLLSIYVAYMLTVLFPFVSWVTHRVPARFGPLLDVALFFALYGIVFMLISHSMRRTRLSLGEISLLQVVLISAVQIGLLASVTVSLLPRELSVDVLGPLRGAVAGERALWLWAAASLLILPLMKSRSKE